MPVPVKDISGQRFGKLVVLAGTYRRVQRGTGVVTVWDCLCDCGTRCSAFQRDLAKGCTISCGCKRRRPRGSCARKIVLKQYRNGAKRRHLAFELSDDTFFSLTDGNCYYCGAPPSNQTNDPTVNGQYTYNGIDRVQNTVGYIDGNCVSCCRTCNFKKGAMDSNDFLEWVSRIYANRICRG